MDFRDTALNRLLAELALRIFAGACLPGPRVKPLAGVAALEATTDGKLLLPCPHHQPDEPTK